MRDDVTYFKKRGEMSTQPHASGNFHQLLYSSSYKLPRYTNNVANDGGGGVSPQILEGMSRGKVKNGGLRIELERENAGLRNELERESAGGGGCLRNWL